MSSKRPSSDSPSSRDKLKDKKLKIAPPASIAGYSHAHSPSPSVTAVDWSKIEQGHKLALTTAFNVFLSHLHGHPPPGVESEQWSQDIGSWTSRIVELSASEWLEKAAKFLSVKFTPNTYKYTAFTHLFASAEQATIPVLEEPGSAHHLDALSEPNPESNDGRSLASGYLIDEWPKQKPITGPKALRLLERVLGAIGRETLSSETRNRYSSHNDKFETDEGWIEKVCRFLSTQDPSKLTTGDLEHLFTYNPIHSYEVTRGPIQQISDESQNRAYRQTYIGEGAKQLIAYLRTQTNKSDLYCRSLHVVQSSGTGKSRMMKEVGNDIITISMCIREGGHGWPPPDKSIRKLFQGVHDSSDHPDTHYVFAAFLHALAEQVVEKLDKIDKIDQKQLAEAWLKYIEPEQLQDREHTRDQFFCAVFKSAEQKLRVINEEFTMVPGNTGEYDKKQLGQNLREVIKRHVLDALRKLSNKGDMIFIVIDEASVLRNQYWAFLRVMHHCLVEGPRLNIWCVFMGTNSSVADFTPIGGDLDSARDPVGQLRLLPPYTGLGFDHAVDNVQRGLDGETCKTLLGEMEKDEWLSMYGRPLWYANLATGAVTLSPGRYGLFKLLGGINQFSPDNKEHAFPVWSSRIYLDPLLSTTHDLKEFIDNAVKSHMRILHRVSNDRELRFTSTPSEPILALGAAIALHMPSPELKNAGKTNLPRPLLSSLKTIYTNTLKYTDKGRLGEMLMRLMLILARDFTHSDDERCTDNHEHNDDDECKDSIHSRLHRPIRLTKFLETLLGKSFGTNDQQEEVDEFKKAFEDMWVNFTHWARTHAWMPEGWNYNNKDATGPELLANMWSRHVALQCRDTQSIADGVVALCKGWKETEPLHMSLMSPLLSQANVQSGVTRVYDLFKPLVSTANPYLCILFDFACESTIGQRGPHIRLYTPDSIRRERQESEEKANKKSRSATPADVSQDGIDSATLQSTTPDPCYIIHIRGIEHFALCQKYPDLKQLLQKFTDIAIAYDRSAKQEEMAMRPMYYLNGHYIRSFLPFDP